MPHTAMPQGEMIPGPQASSFPLAYDCPPCPDCIRPACPSLPPSPAPTPAGSDWQTYGWPVVSAVLFYILGVLVTPSDFKRLWHFFQSRFCRLLENLPFRQTLATRQPATELDNPVTVQRSALQQESTAFRGEANNTGHPGPTPHLEVGT